MNKIVEYLKTQNDWKTTLSVLIKAGPNSGRVARRDLLKELNRLDKEGIVEKKQCDTGLKGWQWKLKKGE